MQRVGRTQSIPKASAPLKVCLGYEGTGPCQAALEELKESPWRGETELHVVTVAACLNEMYADSDCVQHYKDQLVQAKEQLEEVSDSVTTHFIEDVHYGEGITRFVETHDINLVRHVPCSVWITRNRMIEGLKGKQSKSNARSAMS